MDLSRKTYFVKQLVIDGMKYENADTDIHPNIAEQQLEVRLYDNGRMSHRMVIKKDEIERIGVGEVLINVFYKKMTVLKNVNGEWVKVGIKKNKSFLCELVLTEEERRINLQRLESNERRNFKQIRQA